MTKIADPEADAELARPGPPITIDFLPRGPRYAQFVLRPLEPIRDAQVVVRFTPRPIDAPEDIDRIGHTVPYERSFHKGYLDEPIVFIPPPLGPGDVGGMEIPELLTHYKALEVEVWSVGALSSTSILDLADEWDALASAGVVEVIDPAQDQADRDRRLYGKFETLFESSIAEPLREQSHALGSAVRQLIAAQRKGKWGGVGDGELHVLYLALIAALGNSAGAVWPEWVASSASMLRGLAQDIRTELALRDIDTPELPE